MNLYKLASIFLLKSAAKEDVLKDKFPEHANLIDQLSKEDPSGSSKYLEWMLKQAIAGFNLSDIIPSVKYFHNNQHAFEGQQRDINHYKTAKDLEDLIKSIEFAKYEDEDDEGKDIKSENVYGGFNDRFVVIRPDNKEACVSFGKKTDWCITARGTEYYENYNSKNIIFYFIIDKLDTKNNMSKIAYAIYRDGYNKILDYEIFDVNDDPLTDEQVREYMGEEEFVKVLRIMTTDSETRARTENYNDKKVQITTARLAKDSERQWKSYNDPNYRKYLAVNKNLGEEFQMLLVSDNDPVVKRNFAQYNSNIIPEAQMLLANDDDPEVRMRFPYYNKNIIPEAQMLLANDDDPEVRKSFANYKNIIPEAQMLLANDDVPEVRIYFANYKNIIPEAQMLLANDNDPGVRKEFTYNSNMIPEAQMLLANDNDPMIRRNFAYYNNNNIIPEAQMILANDDDDEVRKGFAYSNKNKIAKVQMLLANDENPRVRMNFANNKNIIPEAQMILANDNDPEVRKSFANNINIIPEAQMLLANDDVPKVRIYFANNINIIPEAQILLANDDVPEVRRYLRANPNLTPEAKAILDSRN